MCNDGRVDAMSVSILESVAAEKAPEFRARLARELHERKLSIDLNMKRVNKISHLHDINSLTFT